MDTNRPAPQGTSQTTYKAGAMDENAAPNKPLEVPNLPTDYAEVTWTRGPQMLPGHLRRLMEILFTGDEPDAPSDFRNTPGHACYAAKQTKNDTTPAAFSQPPGS